MNKLLVIPLIITGAFFITGCGKDTTQSQLQWVTSSSEAEPNIIDSAHGTILSVDMDGDGDMDVLSAIAEAGIFWHENNGASSPTFTKHLIASEDGYSIHATDMDGDGDMDVLSTQNDTLVWYQSDGAQEPTFIKQVIDSKVGAVVYAVDLDSDGDMDVAAYDFDLKIAWYENDGAETPTFTRQFIGSLNSETAIFISAGDMDSDGNMDILVSSNYGVVWLLNNGATTPYFGWVDVFEGSSESERFGYNTIHAVDMDHDGDLDVLSAVYGGIVWYENQESTVPYFKQHIIQRRGVQATAYAADVDGDGDMDVVSGHSNILEWYENDGRPYPTFSVRTITTTAGGIQPPDSLAVDLNEDGQLEVLISSTDNGIVWYSTADHYQVPVSIMKTFNIVAITDRNEILVYSIDSDLSSAPDMDYFSIDSGTGELTFSGASTTTEAGDANGDNIYDVVISVTDGFSTLRKKVSVKVVE